MTFNDNVTYLWQRRCCIALQLYHGQIFHADSLVLLIERRPNHLAFSLSVNQVIKQSCPSLLGWLEVDANRAVDLLLSS